MLLDLTENQAQTLQTALDYLLANDAETGLVLADQLAADEETTDLNLHSIRHQLKPQPTDDRWLHLSAKELLLLHLVLYKDLADNPYHVEDLAELIDQQDPNGSVREHLRWLTNPKRK